MVSPEEGHPVRVLLLEPEDVLQPVEGLLLRNSLEVIGVQVIPEEDEFRIGVVLGRLAPEIPAVNVRDDDEFSVFSV